MVLYKLNDIWNTKWFGTFLSTKKCIHCGGISCNYNLYHDFPIGKSHSLIFLKDESVATGISGAFCLNKRYSVEATFGNYSECFDVNIESTLLCYNELIKKIYFSRNISHKNAP